MNNLLSIVYATALFWLVYYKYITGVRCLPEHLKWKVHNDWLFPFKIVPRFFTSYKLTLPRIVYGYNVNCYHEVEGMRCPDPIQRELRGKWCSFLITFPPCVSITIWTGHYFYCGFRWDGVDFYYSFPAIDISKAERFVR